MTLALPSIGYMWRHVTGQCVPASSELPHSNANSSVHFQQNPCFLGFVLVLLCKPVTG